MNWLMPRLDRFDLTVTVADLGPGGAQRMVDNLVRDLDRRGYRICVITLAGPETDHYRLAPGILRRALHLTGPSPNPFTAMARNFSRVAALRRAVRESGAPIVLSFVGTMNILTILACAGLGKWVVISEVNDPSRQSLGRIWDWLRRRAYPRADVVTANSRIALEALRAFVPARKLAWGPNPLLLPGNVTADAPANDGARLLLVARFEHQKAHDVLLHAFAKVAAEFPGWTLVFVGQGRLEASLRTLADTLGIRTRVEWHPPTQDVWPFYRSAQVFVLPSRHEGTPNVLTEALASGLPVIASDAVAGARDYIDDGVEGLFVPVENAAALAEAMRRLMSDAGLRARMGEAARLRMREVAERDTIAPWLAALGLAQRGTRVAP